jgi:HAD superfamily hydrolase (TIGR01509 family)
MVETSLVIFDCDGVLVDSEAISNRVLAQMLTAEGLPTTLAQSRRRYQGLLLADIAADAQRRLGRSLPESWQEGYESARDAAFQLELQPVAGAAQLVEAVRAAGTGVCVASQGKPTKIRLSLELTGLLGLFDEEALFSAYSVPRGKPHPDLFLHAAQRMGVGADACVVIEDTPSGVTAAVSAGMRVIGYGADSDGGALQLAGAELVVESMDDVLGLLRL